MRGQHRGWRARALRVGLRCGAQHMALDERPKDGAWAPCARAGEWCRHRRDRRAAGGSCVCRSLRFRSSTRGFVNQGIDAGRDRSRRRGQASGHSAQTLALQRGDLRRRACARDNHGPRLEPVPRRLISSSGEVPSSDRLRCCTYLQSFCTCCSPRCGSRPNSNQCAPSSS